MQEQHLSDFDFELPPELIAQYPLADRAASRLLHITEEVIEDCTFRDIEKFLRPGDLLIANNTRVIQARRHPGAVAAPTAGLHFTDDLLNRLKAKGVDIEYVTLHVGAGTFQPVRVENLSEHHMHSEWFSMPEDVAARINEAKAQGRRVIAVGTTSLRTLESAADRIGHVEAGARDTRLFIMPGYKFRIVDALVTNFHLPKSTLVMLVSALVGRERILEAYAHAVREHYRFFSYGDACFIEKARGA